MTAPTRKLLLELAAELTGMDASTAGTLLDAPATHQQQQQLERLRRLVQQTPLRYASRANYLAGLIRLEADVLAEPGFPGYVDQLRSLPPVIPTAGAGTIELPPLTPQLDEVYRILFDLDEHVAEPWTLIGGLMVLTHCAEHGVRFNRPTGDADVAVSVFTHRRALQEVTSRLTRHGLHDASPDSMSGGDRLSYRYVSADGVKVDVAVPPKVNDQRHPPLSVGGRFGVELPAIQQALSRTERIHLTTSDGASGYVRRPNLLGSIIIKATASITDNRNPERHREDLITLGDVLVVTGQFRDYRSQMSTQDRRRLRRALSAVPDRLWRTAQDAEAAQGALTYLLNR